MKNNFYFFVGLFAALLVSWLGIVLGSNAQLGALPPYYDDAAGSTYPEWMPGVAAQGQLVYKDLGCIACHTQQVRRPGFGSDQARGWGDRQSVARDYIYQPFPQLGSSRIGPDLTNLADRKPSAMDADDLMNLLYAGKGGMPSYRFLFEHRKIGVGAQRSAKALNLTGKLKPEDGWEIVPTTRADSLVGYLINLKTTFTYPEAAPFVPAKPEGEAAKPAPATVAAPAATPPAGTPAATPAPSTPAAGAAAAPPANPAPSATPPAGANGAAPVPAAATTPAPPANPAPSATPPAGANGAAPAPAAATTPAPSAAPSAPAAPAPATTPPAPEGTK